MHACQGTWDESNSGVGVEAGAAHLCAVGASLCTYEDMQTITSEACDSLNGFYASGVSSDGYGVCNSDDTGANDIWG